MRTGVNVPKTAVTCDRSALPSDSRAKSTSRTRRETTPATEYKHKKTRGDTVAPDRSHLPANSHIDSGIDQGALLGERAPKPRGGTRHQPSETILPCTRPLYTPR